MSKGGFPRRGVALSFRSLSLGPWLEVSADFYGQLMTESTGWTETTATIQGMFLFTL